MLNRIWFWLLFIGILYGPARLLVAPWFAEAPPPPAVVTPVDGDASSPVAVDPPASPASTPPKTFGEVGKRINEAALDGAKVSVEVCLSLIAIMVLWLGLLQVASDAGLVDALARLLRPMMRWLFPGVPDGHPGQGAILMNMAANMLGLDNAATPFGLKAMQELDTLNPQKGTATNAMATFLAINTSSVTLVPIAIIGLRVAAGSENPSAPLFGILLATVTSTVVAVIAVRLLERLPMFAVPSDVAPGEVVATTAGDLVDNDKEEARG